MSINYWYKQTIGTPVFPELEWSRPENKLHAGKLLIVGGNMQGFSAPALAFNEAAKAGIGTSRIVLPDAIKRTVQSFIPEAEFAATTPSGSFATGSLDTLLDNAAWSDATLLAGDLGRNSETAITLENFMNKHTGLVALTKDAVDYFTDNSQPVVNRPNTLLVVSLSQLQKLAINARFTTAFTFSMDLVRLVTALHEFTTTFPVEIIVKHHDVLIAAADGKVSTTKLDQDKEIWRVSTAAHAVVWRLQHSSKPFEALTTSVVS